MRIIGKKGLSGASEVFLVILMILAVGLLALMPWWLKSYLAYRNNSAYYTEYLVLLYISGLFAEVLLFLGYRLMHNINRSQPFIMQNAKIIKNIAVCCIILCVVYVAAVPFVPSIFTAVIAMAFAVISTIAFVCAELFKQAVIFKEENELTI